MPAGHYDVAVVGAGIVGLAVAREMLARRPDAKLIVIDKAGAVAQYQTGHNSGVIHAGVYYAPGSLKARLCVAGARLMYEFCEANAIPVERCGKLIVAVRDDELPRLADLERRGRANGCAEYVPAITSLPIERRPVSGIRAQAVSRGGKLVDDFTISQTPGATHVRNAPSPAATSSLALAREIVDQYEAASA